MKGEATNPSPESVISPAASSRALKVCVVEFLGHGGLIHYAYQMCSALSAEGVDVELITDRDYELESRPHNFRAVKLLNLWNPRPRGKVEWKEGLRAKGARVFRRAIRAAAYYRAWGALIRYVLKSRPDIVQFGEIRFVTDFFPLAVLRAYGIRLADVCHNIAPFNIEASSRDVLKMSPFYQRAFSRIYKSFAVIFVHSEVNRSEFTRLYGDDGSLISVIPHGNEALFTAGGRDANANELRERLDIPSDAPVALFFGTLTKYKGLEVLIDAFRTVVNSIPDARLIIAGFPNPDVDVAHLKEQRRKNNLNSSVIFHLEYVPVEDVAAFFEISDVAVLPYLMIFQSGALQVAYSFGKPVVATAVGGLKEAVEDGGTGLLVPPQDSQALAEAITTLLSDKVAAERMGARAKVLSETLYSWQSIASRVKNSYLEVCRGSQKH